MRRQLKLHQRRIKEHIVRHKKIAGIVGIVIVTGIFLGHHITNSYSQKPQTVTMEKEINLLQGQWSYLPGVRRDGSGLVVKPTNISLVEQNGSTGQENPPINAAGTYIASLSGDFSLKTQLMLQGDNHALIKLYGRAPIVADEFRVEREGLILDVDKGSLVVNTRSNTGQLSKYPKTFHFAPNTTINLTIKRLSTILAFEVNGVSLGTIPTGTLFSSKQFFFGLESTNGEWRLANMTMIGLNGGTFQLVDGSQIVTPHDPNGLQALASKKRPGFIVGMARAINPSFTDPDYQKIAFDKNMFGGLTPENAMKMVNLQPQRGVYTFEQADALVAAAQQNGIQVHGHTLVFGEANPPWFNALPDSTPLAKQQIENIMKDHITTVVSHFKGKVSSWDVINEPMADYDDTPDGEGAVLRDTKWYRAMGEDFIIKAIATAHNADPNANLFINEYGLEDDGDRWDAFVALMKRVKIKMKEQNIPLDKVGVGFQSHVYEPNDRIQTTTLKRHIEQLGALGFKVQISEMDVYGDYNGSDKSADQAKQYTDVFQACLSEKNCIAWRGWVLSDKYDYFKDDDGSIYQGIDGLFDTNMKPRPAYTKMQASLM